jgi:hypothetical protein
MEMEENIEISYKSVILGMYYVWHGNGKINEINYN